MSGYKMGQKDDSEVDCACGIPDSGVGMALGYAEGKGIPYHRAIAKYTPTWPRSFTPANQEMRSLVAKMKLIPNRAMLEGKRVLFCDDSIVRGTQLRDNVKILFDYGAKEVHMRISSPSVLNPCYFGIDTVTSEELIGHSRSVEEICRFIGADSLKFLSLPDLLKTVAGSGCQFCTGCFDGDYPIDPETGEMHGMEEEHDYV